MKNKKYVTIVKVVGEGGGISILGKEEKGIWKYTVCVNESLLEYFNEKDSVQNKSHTKYHWFHDWEEAFEKFTQYPICILKPRNLQKDYVDKVLISLNRKYNRIPKLWKEFIIREYPEIYPSIKRI